MHQNSTRVHGCLRSLLQAPVAIGSLIATIMLTGVCRADDLAARSTWSVPAAEEARQQVVQWLEQSQAGPESKLKFDALWPPEAQLQTPQLLPMLTDVAAALLEPARPLVDLVHSDRAPAALPTFEVLQDDSGAPEFLRNNLKLVLAKWLVEQHLVDEALTVLEGVEPQHVVDPAGLLFYRSVALHRLLKKEECLPVLTRLLENEESLPIRYRTVAKLMEADLRPLKTDSLDEVARMLSDIRRRLGLGRAGTRVRTEEDEVVRKLEKMIEDMEKQQQQQQGGGGGQAQSNRPMDDSQPGGGTGPGDVQQRRLGNRSDWGDLPPKEREEALQEITKELPAHFRSVIEEYFRKLARNAN